MRDDIMNPLIGAFSLLLVGVLIGLCVSVAAQQESEKVCRHTLQRNFHVTAEEAQRLIEEERQHE